ncbi:MAG: NlpC/P60 family protein [Draconibacterium sp.]
MNHSFQKKYNFIARITFIALLCLIIFSCHSPQQNKSFDPLISEISQRFAPDKRIAVLNFDIRETKQGIVLKGKTNLKGAHDFLLDTLATMNKQVIDSITLLPDTQLADKTWGLITLSVIPMRKPHDYSAEMVSQTMMGTPVKLLEKKGGWYLIQTPDQYIGWVSASGIVSLTAEEMNVWKSSRRYIFTQMYGSALEAPQKDATVVSDLVMGNIFVGKPTSNGFLHITLPDGREGFVPAADCLDFKEWQARIPEAANIIKTAKKMLGSPYLWGGTSTKGIDCSGFTKTAYFSQGIMLARDASQQALYGEQLNIRNFGFQPGDLLFFGRSKERITHVGMYIGNDRFIHSSGRVRINSFNADDEDYEPGRKKSLVAACRVLNSLNTGQIIPIKDHPWYN